ncbi:MAG TPA: hypothetical protein VH165_34580 [Kofleriaceae bacterium]|jgi:hypothetical protein|nr:hypothetical protein [Kofleriaceae bacterium]
MTTSHKTKLGAAGPDVFPMANEVAGTRYPGAAMAGLDSEQ